MDYKRIYDPVHRFIGINPIEDRLIRSRPFERLRMIHQCGSTFFVYPGGSHKRFEHSLGVMHVATQIYDKVMDSVDGELFEKAGSENLLKEIPKKGSEQAHYWRQILRLACLCHDMGHLPFSHVAEKALLEGSSHEGWSYKMIMAPFMQPVFDSFQQTLQGELAARSVQEDVAKVALGPGKHVPEERFSPFEKALSSMLVGDCFGADRIDYLLRDAFTTGLVYGQFDHVQLIDMLRFIPFSNQGEPGIDLGILENGLESCQSLLLARHFMYKKIYNYPRIKAFDFHLARFMKAQFSHITEDIETYLDTSDIEVLYSVRRAVKDPKAAGHLDALSLKGGREPVKALILPSFVKQEHLTTFMEQYGLQRAQISWELDPKAGQYMQMNIPTIKMDKKIALTADQFPVKIPRARLNWLYIEPSYEEKFTTFLKFITQPVV
jgi:uncharacterized protein